jgi:hypothetical protein
MTVTALPVSAPPLAAFLRPELPGAALYGLPGMAATALASVTEADPAALLLTFLTLFGSACGPEPHVQFGPAAHPARLFTLLCGDAASGRKGTALAAVEPLFEEADPDWFEERRDSGIQSAEAMIERVADDSDEHDCRLLETMARTGKLSQQLSIARSRKRPVRATRAHISLLGNITPTELNRYYARLRNAGGLESRMLFAYVTKTRDLSPF